MDENQYTFQRNSLHPQSIVIRKGISEEWIHDLYGPSALGTFSLPYLVPYKLCSYSSPLSQQGYLYITHMQLTYISSSNQYDSHFLF